MKNWLAQGSKRSTVEVLTNIAFAMHDPVSKVRKDGSLHRGNWRKSTSAELIGIFTDLP